MTTAIGLIEMTSIARGIEVSDTMLKAGRVELDFAKPVCPGKFIVMVHGDVGAVQASVKAGLETGKGVVVNQLVIPRVHPSVLPAVNAALEVPAKVAALGVVEYFDIASAIVGADAAVKAAKIQLIEVRLGVGIGGKSFVKLTGQVSDVRSAVKECLELAKVRGTVVSTCVVPSPNPALFREML
ncbi:MAG: BMC domain-containing protein [Propionibacteriaceae bacterium]|jgi:microcompartment protein CcmL/EutN|nr:BMC domain-containing protein [Propionibacteriaceae bacterium]